MDLIRDCAESVASHWQQLMLKMEDRLKLVNASVAFYKTSEQVGDHIQGDFLYSRNQNVLQTSDWECFSCQVCSVLESLEQEYKREEDWCGGADKLGPNCETDHVSPMISKHLEQKEAFLKVTHTNSQDKTSAQFQVTRLISVGVNLSHQACTLARRNADVFLKYMHRNSVNMPGMLSHVKAPEQQVKSECQRTHFTLPGGGGTPQHRDLVKSQR